MGTLYDEKEITLKKVVSFFVGGACFFKFERKNGVCNIFAIW